MFKFDFNIEAAEDLDETLIVGNELLDSSEVPQESRNAIELEPFSELDIDQLLGSLPDKISYSPLSISLSSGRKSVTLIRRDLFDARFQLISEAGDQHPNNKQENDAELDASFKSLSATSGREALEFFDNPSDLIPGVYEGGLKTWECSLDLVDYLDKLKDQPNYRGFSCKKVLELGCGTGIPSLYVFQELLLSSPIIGSPSDTELHLQDYNIPVLQLVTLPNFLLTWYASSHSSTYRTSKGDPELAPSIDPTIPGELPITPDLKHAFVSSLKSLNLVLRFFSGSWQKFDPRITLGQEAKKYDVVLTSETIYCLDSLPSLVDLMHSASTGDDVSRTTLESNTPPLVEAPKNIQGEYLCLVAGKAIYFGVGGGMSNLLNAVRNVGGTAETVSERRIGVGRKVVRVIW